MATPVGPLSQTETPPQRGDDTPFVRQGTASLKPAKLSRFHGSKKIPQTVRERYLDYLQKDVEQRMKASIHVARFLDIGVDEKLNATVPWYFKALEGQQKFATFDQAFQDYDGRVLLLGPPGSGKTTTLLNLALRLITEAQQDETAPIPLLFNLSKFSSVSSKRISEQLSWLHKRKEPTDENPAQVFEQWLIQMLIEIKGVEGLNRQIAQQWVNSGEVAILLDGLDEVNDSYVLNLAEIMNHTYFRQHPNQTVVVCSRIIEYQPLQENKEARLRLNGAVILQPPTREQIDSYLEDAKALALRDALRDDDVLYEMAQTPLTLSMMTLAYGGEAPTDIPHDLPFLERRRKLLDTYVERMVQRFARRAQGVPFDLNPDNDVPLQYRLRQTNHYLGWLAIKLSERMRTLFPLERLYGFLSEQPREVEARSLGLKYTVAMIAFWLIALITNAGLLMQRGWTSDWLWLALIPLLAPLAVFVVALNDVTTSKRWYGKVESGSIVAVLVYVSFCFGLVNRAVLSLLPSPPNRFVITEIVLAVVLVGSLLVAAEYNGWWDKVRGILLSCLKLLLMLTVAATIAAVIGRDLKFAWYGISIGSYLICLFWLRKEGFNDTPFWIYIPSFVGISAVAIAIAYGAAWLIGSHELLALATAVTILFGILAADEEWMGTPLTLAVAVLLGHLAGGPSVAVLAVIAVLLFHIGWLKDEAETVAERLIFNPLLRFILPLGRKICFRYEAFLHYAINAMLLKRVGTEYEFVHRLLRDHFAIRELIPALYQAEGEKRIAVIQRLSRQGDSSFDTLANLTTHTESRIRSAAVEGLGRIAIPKVLPIMETLAQQDPSDEVRSAVMQSLRKFGREEKGPIFLQAMKDPSPEVRRSVVDASEDNTILNAALTDDADIVFRQALIAIASQSYFYLMEQFEPKTVRRLGEALLAADPNVSKGAAHVLSRAFRYRKGGVEERLALAETVIPALLTRYRDKEETVRNAMISAISSIAQPDIATEQQRELKAALMEALKDKSFEVRNEAIPGLASLRDPEALAALRDLLSRRDYSHKELVIKELGSAQDKLAVPALMKEITDPMLRYHVAVALGSIDDRSIVPQLQAWLDEDGGSSQIGAIMALVKLGVDVSEKLRPLFLKPPVRSKRYLWIFSRLPAADLRPYAAAGLAALGAKSALPDLANLPAEGPPQLLVAQIYALRRFSYTSIVEELLSQRIQQFSSKEREELLKTIGECFTDYQPMPVTLESKEVGDLVIFLLKEDWIRAWTLWPGSDDWQFLN